MLTVTTATKVPMICLNSFYLMTTKKIVGIKASEEHINAHLTTGVCVVVCPGRCDDECLCVVDKEGEDAHQQGGHFHHPPHILLPLSPSLHCAAFRGARAAGRPLWPQLLATPAHEADCTRRQRVKLALYLSINTLSALDHGRTLEIQAVVGAAVSRLIWGSSEL